MNILLAQGGSGGPLTYGKILEKELPKFGITITTVNFQNFFKYPSIIRHLRYVIELIKVGRNSEYIYALDAATVGFPAWLVSCVIRKKFYIRIPGDWVWEQGVQRWGIQETLDQYLDRTDYPFVVRLLRWGQGFVTRRADKVIVPSNYLKKVVTKWNVPEKKILVIYNSYESTPYFTEEIKKSHRIVSIGRLVPWKGFSVLIQSICELRKEIPDISLVILGDGPEMKQLTKKVEELDARSYVTFLGNIEKENLKKEVSLSELFVLNTGYEGLSHTLLEVMDLGVPIITTVIGGNPEVVENGKNGILVPYNDKEALKKAITSVITDKGFRDTLVREGKDKVREFSLDVMINRTVSLFK